MYTTLNLDYLKQKLRAASRRQILGILLVIFSFTLSLFMGANYALVLVAYPALIAGFPLWQFARGSVRRWRGEREATAVVVEEIRPGPKQHLFGYVPVGGTMIDYLLVGPEGLLVIELKGVGEGLVTAASKGTVEYRGGGIPIACRQKDGQDQWSQRLPLLERLARTGEGQLGNPSAVLTDQIAKLKAWLEPQNLTRTPVPIWGVIVFRNPETRLDIEDCQYEVLHLSDLRAFLNLGEYFDQDMRATVLPAEERTRLIAAVSGLLPAGARTVESKPAAPARKLSPAHRAELERVREIRAARAASPAGQAGKSAHDRARRPAPPAGTAPAPRKEPPPPGRRDGA